MSGPSMATEWLGPRARYSTLTLESFSFDTSCSSDSNCPACGVAGTDRQEEEEEEEGTAFSPPLPMPSVPSLLLPHMYSSPSSATDNRIVSHNRIGLDWIGWIG